jgi:hypothetical protein
MNDERPMETGAERRLAEQAMQRHQPRASLDPPRACDCPERDGRIRHQRATCTDPVAAKLGWYADDDPGRWEIAYTGQRGGDLITDPYLRAAAERGVQLPDEPDPDDQVWLNDEAALLVTVGLQRGLTAAQIRAAVEGTLALHDPAPAAAARRQPILRIGLPGIPETCEVCGVLIGDAPLEMNGGRLCATCPGCHAVIAPVRLVAAAGTPLPALGGRVSDQHLQDRHGPILTRGDLERAEAEHRYECLGDDFTQDRRADLDPNRDEAGDQ